MEYIGGQYLDDELYTHHSGAQLVEDICATTSTF